MIINDPVHGFIDIPKGLITTLVDHPYFIRLHRISQLGPTAYVYPGGCHSRFSHSIGTLHLISEALRTLRRKGCHINEQEEESVKAAMLLHDIGHSPMSHCLEKAFIHDMSHEQITIKLMGMLNQELGGALSMAIEIFKDTYHKHFLHELICSQLDMDRLDYLCRDSFFVGVREGNIGIERIIKMLNVKDDRLVVEAKGIYTIENYLMSRRLMYWQVYLHKTALAAQETIRAAIERAGELSARGVEISASESFKYFLKNNIDAQWVEKSPQSIHNFMDIDDNDVISALKQWINSEDRVLSMLASNYVNRNLYRAIEISGDNKEQKIQEMQDLVANKLGISNTLTHYFVRKIDVSQMLYSTTNDHISILMKDGTLRDISDFSELLHTEMVDRSSKRHYVLVQRGI